MTRHPLLPNCKIYVEFVKDRLELRKKDKNAITSPPCYKPGYQLSPIPTQWNRASVFLNQKTTTSTPAPSQSRVQTYITPAQPVRRYISIPLQMIHKPLKPTNKDVPPTRAKRKISDSRSFRIVSPKYMYYVLLYHIYNGKRHYVSKRLALLFVKTFHT